jgi:hypothetical protein
MTDVLVPHPYALLVVDRTQERPDRVRLYCPVPGKQLRETRISQQPDPELFALLVQIAEAETIGDLECTEAQAEFLVSIGYLVTEDEVAQLSFPCTLDIALLQGLPKRVVEPQVAAQDVEVNPTLAAEVGRDEAWSPHASAVRNLFPARRIWLEDPRTGQRVPFGRSSLVERLLERGTGALASLDERDRRLLQLAGALVPGSARDAAVRWSLEIDTARDAFSRDRYCAVRNVIPPLQLAALRLHYRSLLAKSCFAFGDAQVDRRYWRYQERIARFYHHLLVPITSRIAGRPVKPSYAYFASYVPGAVLERHIDREQCEVSISLLVDCSPEPEDVSGWPIFVESPSNPGRVVAIDQGPGDALFYKGCEVYHHRDALPEGRTSTSLFFHYVPEESTARRD